MSTKRLYISADIEGVAGVVSAEQLGPKGFEYREAREWMTGEVIAACEAAFNNDVDEIVVSDSHGNGQNLLIDKLPDRVTVVRSWPRPLCMMEGIQEGAYIGAALIGYHTGATADTGVLAHTMHGGGIIELRLNGEPASETVISSAMAAHFGVPIILATGDDAYVAHARDVNGSIETVTTKWVSAFTSARMKKPETVREEIGAAMRTALARLGEFKPVSVAESYTLDVVCKRRSTAEILGFLPCVEQVDGITVRFAAKDMIAVSKFTAFLLSSGVLTAG